MRERIIDDIIKCNKCELKKLEVNNETNQRFLVDALNFRRGQILVVAQNPSSNRTSTSVLSSSSNTDRMFLGALQSLGIQRTDLYCTNIVKCSTLDNADPKKYAKMCECHLYDEISYIRPKAILALGALAIQFFSGARGKVTKWGNLTGTYYVYSAFHPTFLSYKGLDAEWYAEHLKPLLDILKKQSEATRNESRES